LIDYNIINNQTNCNFFTIFEATKEKNTKYFGGV
jgi:hypothetical protein